MADLKKALDAVSYGIHAAECAGDSKGRSLVVMMKTDDLDNIQELLKKQEPKSAIVMKNEYGYRFFYCPGCNRGFYDGRKPKYCDKCGQAVKWE